MARRRGWFPWAWQWTTVVAEEAAPTSGTAGPDVPLGLAVPFHLQHHLHRPGRRSVLQDATPATHGLRVLQQVELDGMWDMAAYFFFAGSLGSKVS